MQVIPPFSWHFIYPFRYALYMSLHVKKINHQFSVLKKPELSGFFHAHVEAERVDATCCEDG